MRVEGALAALGDWRVRAPGVGDPCLLTHPAHRGRGLAAIVLGGLCERALARDDLVLYQTLASNTPAVRAALRTGFHPEATHLSLRGRA